MATPFEEFVNNELPKRPWTPVPLSGSLVAGQALVATGVGMEVEQKLVQFQDPLMVRYVGDQPGDYATFEEALASLPSDAGDLSTNSNPYTIYFRGSISHLFAPGIIINGIRGLLLYGIPIQEGGMVTLSCDENTTDSPFGIKFISDLSSSYLYLTNLNFGIGSVTYAVPQHDGIDFNLLEFESTSSYICALLLNNTNVVLGLSVSRFTPTLPKKVSAIYAYTTASSGAALYVRVFNKSKFHLLRSSAKALGSDLAHYVFLDSAENSYINIQNYFATSPTTGYKASNDVLTLHCAAPTGWGPAIMLRLRWQGSSVSYWDVLGNIVCHAEYNYTASIVNDASIAFMQLYDYGQPRKVNIPDLKIYVSSSSTSNSFNLSNLVILDSSLGPVKTAYLNIDSATLFLPTAGAGAIGGKPVFARCVNGTIDITNSSIGNSDIIVLGSAKVFGAIIKDRSLLIADNISRDEKQITTIESRTNGKQYLTQSPLAPVAPQPGDLWIETTEQY